MIPAVDLNQTYMQAMPYSATDQFAGRLHHCPICLKKVWSTFGHARKHWEMHQNGTWRSASCGSCHTQVSYIHNENARALRRIGWTVCREWGNLCYDCACEEGYNR
jgi:hypothetical protein